LQWKFDDRLTAVRDAGQIRSQYRRVRPGERLAARLGFAAKRPLKGGTKWKTLDDVKMVVVADVDSKDNPQKIEVYIFPAIAAEAL